MSQEVVESTPQKVLQPNIFCTFSEKKAHENKEMLVRKNGGTLDPPLIHNRRPFNKTLTAHFDPLESGQSPKLRST